MPQSLQREDIFIACVDGLKGFPEAIAAVFPQTRVQLCIVHLIRNSLRYVPWGSQAEVVIVPRYWRVNQGDGWLFQTNDGLKLRYLVGYLLD